MAILKKLMCFQTQANFDERLAAGEVLETSIVFVKDTRRIWTHGAYFGSSADLGDYYTKSETYSREEVDALVKEIDDAVDELSGKVSELEDSQVSVAAGENVAVTKDGNVYTVSAEVDTSNLATKDELSDVSDKVESNSSSIENLQEQITEIESGGADLTNYYTKGETDELLEGKQNTLSTGENVTIEDDTISVDLSGYATESSLESGLAGKQDTLTQGEGISISEDNVISCTIDPQSGVKGDKGDPGEAATVSVGTTTTGEAGTDALVVNSGTVNAAVLDFTIPRGEKGEKGDQGEQGPQGEKGDTGATGATGAQGDKGDKGDKGDTGDAGVASVSASGTAPLTLSGSMSGTTLTITGSVANATASTAGVVKPYSVLSSSPTCNSVTTTSGRYYRISTNSSNVLIVNVPWTDTTYTSGDNISISSSNVISATMPTLSGLGGIDSVSASGTSPLTLSASKSGTAVTISGSVDLSSYATTASLSGYALKSDLDDYALKSDLSTYVTTTSLSSQLGDYLKLSGGTMTGDIKLGSSGAKITSDGHIVLASGVEIY